MSLAALPEISTTRQRVVLVWTTRWRVVLV